MAKINLRAYIREIEEMVDSGDYTETIAHCRYILEHFPKHVATYRLLGKALLENRRYHDAADIFQRVLSCIPDDFIAHLGMSIIREEEGSLDNAIWHMERAFEVQPSNAAVQVELRRLYGRRDGLTPPKVHLTRGALARMSAKSHLHSQAITELRAALSEDPNRPDLQVLLASLYASSGQRVAAAEICNALLNKLPYCLEANRILADILPGTERASEAQTYRQRLEALDPYAAFLSPSAPSPEQVADEAVVMERFEYPPPQPVVPPAQPEETALVGISIEGSPPSQEPLPAWLSSIAGEALSDEPDLSLSSDTAEEKIEGEGQIPEYQFTELESTMEPGIVEHEPISATTQQEISESEKSAEEELLPWIESPSLEPETEPYIPPPVEAQGDDIPDWLKVLGASALVETGHPEEEISPMETEALIVSQEVEPVAGEIPTLLQEIETSSSEELAPVSEAPTGPPLDLEPESASVGNGEIAHPLVTAVAAEQIESELEKTNLPSMQLDESPIEGDTQPVRVERELPGPLSEERVLEVEAISDEESLFAEESQVEPGSIPGIVTEEPEEIQPSPLEAEIEGLPPEGSIITEEIPAEPGLTSGFMLEETEVTLPASPEEEDSVIAWLESLAARQETSDQELPTAPEESIAESPEWEKQVSQFEEEIPEVPIAEPLVWEGEATLSEEVFPTEPEPAPEAEPEIPEWLREFIEEPTPTPVEETPTWLPTIAPSEEVLEPSETEQLDASIGETVAETTSAPSPLASTQLMQAWNSLTSGDRTAAIEQYTQMIHSGQDIDLVVMHLQEALLLHPADPMIHQTLGDAYLRADKLQEALDSYMKAEELI